MSKFWRIGFYLRTNLRITYGHLRDSCVGTIEFDLFHCTYGCTYGWLTGTYGFALKRARGISVYHLIRFSHLRITYGYLRICRKNDHQSHPYGTSTYGMHLRTLTGLQRGHALVVTILETMEIGCQHESQLLICNYAALRHHKALSQNVVDRRGF